MHNLDRGAHRTATLVAAAVSAVAGGVTTMAASNAAADGHRPRPGPVSGPRPSPVPVRRPLPTAMSPEPTDLVRMLRPSRRAVLLTGAAGLLALPGFASGANFARRLPADTAMPAIVAARRAHVRGGDAAGHPLTQRVTVTHGHPGHPIRRLDDLRHHHPAFAPRAIMLTLDDGPHPVWTPRMLDLLGHAGVIATFFMIGSQVRRDPGLVREVAARGHAIGNHTWSHDEWLGHRPVAHIRSEIARTSDAIHAACGVVPTLFRAPGGNWQPRLLAVLAGQQLLPVGWDRDPMDWARPGTRAIVGNLSRLRPHDIALCHDGGGDRSQTWHALHAVLPRWQHRRFTFVTLTGTG